METVIRIQPNHYIHVLDNNNNITKVVVGPCTFTKQEHQTIARKPTKMVNIPPRHFVTILNPVRRDKDGNPVLDEHGLAKLYYGETEIRLAEGFPEPFPLYPGEVHQGGVKQLKTIENDAALRIQATREFVAEDGTMHQAGDEWLVYGPATYTPRVEEEVKEKVRSLVIKQNCALKLRAVKDFTSRDGIKRTCGEEWLVRDAGAFLPSVNEIVVSTLRAQVLTEKRALHLRAVKTFKDVYRVERKAGSEWLITFDMAETHLQDVHEETVGTVDVTTLSQRQYAILVNYYEGGKQKLGCKKLLKGEVSFFLKPGETLDGGIQDIYVLAEDEALLLQALSGFVDDDGEERAAGERWMVFGPCEYVPSVEVTVVETRRQMPLDENEGVYVRDSRVGEIRAVIGQTYMLEAHEELWEKQLSEDVEELLLKQSGGNVYLPPDGQAKSAAAGGGGGNKGLERPTRNKTKVISFRVPHNAAVQVYDYKQKEQRIVFGPELVMLDPNEQLTTLSLSGGRPKRPDVIQTLCLMLGPDFMTDVVTVETCDHARLSLQLAYNWQFEIEDRTNAAEVSKIFNVRDFVGDAAKAMASRVRGAVATETFDNFHKYSARLIRQSIFGCDADGKIGDRFKFDTNNLLITNVDIQAVEPVDDRTRESLQRSVQLAIEITTASQEARAQQEAQCEEEEAAGILEQQTIKNQAQAEVAKAGLLELQASSAAIEAQGAATAAARAQVETALIEGEAAVKQAQLQAQALKIEAEAKLEQMKLAYMAEIKHKKDLMKLELDKAKEMAELEAAKFKDTVDAIGADTIAEIAQAGPEMQAKLLEGLGLNGFLVTDGKSPINLFQTASGMVGGAQ